MQDSSSEPPQSNFWYLDDGVLLGSDGQYNYLASSISQCSILRSCVAQHHILRYLVLPLAALISALPSSKKVEGSQPFTFLLPKLCDPQSAIALPFCRLAHLARSIPPSAASLEEFASFDVEGVLHCCLECKLEIESTGFEACNHHASPQVCGGLGLLQTP